MDKIFEKVMDKVMFENDPGVCMELSFFCVDWVDTFRTNSYGELCLATSYDGRTQYNSRIKRLPKVATNATFSITEMFKFSLKAVAIVCRERRCKS